MKISITAEGEVRDGTKPVSAFPGAVQLPGGDILLLFSSSSAFESSDAKLKAARSSDGGKTWTIESDPCVFAEAEMTTPFDAYAKPTVLPDGEIIAAGYGFFRDRPEMGLSDYAEKFGRFPRVGNFLLRSFDNGHSWCAPEWIRHPYDGLELSGPALACRDGMLRFFAAPFVLSADLRPGYAFESSDGGRTWRQSGIFFSMPGIAIWETRAVELPSGRIVLAVWAFDLKAQKNLNNHLIWSDDGGKTWSLPADTGLRGQAANFLLHGSRLALLQARREGNASGIFLNTLAFTDTGTVRTGPDCRLWDARGTAEVSGSIEQQFAGLKFGQPSVLHLEGASYLLIFWQCLGNTFSIRTRHFTIDDPFEKTRKTGK
ncbi:MAG: exo-alpha-sialidase [Lentisphaeria bacterium]|nr:exo-alpha-sialidase [Lentisphaeria bacterium]